MREGKKIKDLNVGKTLDSVLGIMDDVASGRGRSFRDDKFRDQVNDIVVDTIKTTDTGLWETAISRDNQESWTIVEQYESRVNAKEGHIEWFKDMMEHPDRELKDIYL